MNSTRSKAPWDPDSDPQDLSRQARFSLSGTPLTPVFPRCLALSLVALMAVGAISAQSLSATLAVAKPVVDKWDAEYKAGNRTTAVRDHVVAEIQEFLAQHTADVWAYE